MTTERPSSSSPSRSAGPGLSTALLSIAHGRHDHLTALLGGIAGSTLLPDRIVVAAMDDPEIAGVVAAHGPTGVPADVLRVDASPGGGLPLAAARNQVAEHAIAAGAELLVFLDVDCIPSPGLLGRYREVAAAADPEETDVWSGAVHYLPPPLHENGYSAGELAASVSHPARPVPPDDEVWPTDDLRLFWSLSFAVSAASWRCVGGFDEAYDGYGGEDTDFAMRLAQQQGRLSWVGGAAAFHQHHEVESPPRRHLVDIVRNSNRFAARWGHFPMDGWLTAFADEGLIMQAGQPPRWHLTAAGHNAARRP
ncbi:MAG: glycosyltransferase family 2 protein [Humibacillus sp.]|nr:glycosyltransferase family 2 protein [Humibacillus sp.]